MLCGVEFFFAYLIVLVVAAVYYNRWLLQRQHSEVAHLVKMFHMQNPKLFKDCLGLLVHASD